MWYAFTKFKYAWNILWNGFEGFTKIQVDHTHCCYVSYPQEKNIIEFKQVPCSKKDRIYVCVLKCRMNILLRSRKRRLFRLSCCRDHCRCKKERLALFVIQNLNELEVVCLFTTKLVDANLAHIRIDYS